MIDKWLSKVDQANTQLLFWGVVAGSILLAAWMQTIQHGWINPDSVLYFEQAKRFALGEWSAGFNTFKWPLYGLCISLTHKITSLPIQASAQLLNMLFFGMATASYLQLIKLAGGNNRTWLMGTLLLFSSQYIVGDILEMLMRDEGFWAFYLTALVFFIRFSQQRKGEDAVLWQLCIIIATLFRIEAILFLLILPITYLFTQVNLSIKPVLQYLLNTYSVSLFLGIIIAIAILTQPQLSMSSFGRLNEIFTSDLYRQFTQKLFTQAEIMSSQVLGTYLNEFAIPGLLLTFVYVIGSKTLTSTGLIGTALAFCCFKRAHQNIDSGIRNVLLIAGCIALFSAALIILKVFVLSSRYIVSLAWILLIFASFYLAELSLSRNKNTRITFIILCAILSLGFIKNVLPKRNGYNYQQTAVAWVQIDNTQNKQVFYDNSRQRYYAKEPYSGKYSFKNLQSVINKELPYEYLMININKGDQNKIDMLNKQLPDYREVKRFYSASTKKYCAVYLKQN